MAGKAPFCQKKSKSLYLTQHLYEKWEGSGSISLTKAVSGPGCPKICGSGSGSGSPTLVLSHRKDPDIYKYTEVPYWYTHTLTFGVSIVK